MRVRIHCFHLCAAMAFGFAAAAYPVFATEFEEAQTAQPGATQAAYGPSIINCLESKGINGINRLKVAG